jgi:hypothetical protein
MPGAVQSGEGGNKVAKDIFAGTCGAILPVLEVWAELPILLRCRQTLPTWCAWMCLHHSDVEDESLQGH